MFQCEPDVANTSMDKSICYDSYSYCHSASGMAVVFSSSVLTLLLDLTLLTSVIRAVMVTWYRYR